MSAVSGDDQLIAARYHERIVVRRFLAWIVSYQFEMFACAACSKALDFTLYEIFNPIIKTHVPENGTCRDVHAATRCRIDHGRARKAEVAGIV